ncbi:MAG: hypothetical protein IPM96_21240 [Ignavibacteria bacterium]|nr:hypothetical protein [Ignavibacteria bacterium]
MTAVKLRNIIAKKISELDDIEVLKEINSILESKTNNNDIYYLNHIQRKKIRKSKQQFKEGMSISNEKVFDEIEKWLKEK